MKVEITFDTQSVQNKMEASIAKVHRGTKKATVAALEEIQRESLAEVPKNTSTLASTSYIKVIGSYKNFTGEIGYGGDKDARNPETGAMASSYMLPVHENLDAIHPNGKAKFLEDPLRRYAKKLANRASQFIKNELR